MNLIDVETELYYVFTILSFGKRISHLVISYARTW